MFRKLAITVLGAAMFLTVSVPALAMPRGNGLPVIKSESVQLIGHRYSRRHYRKRHYRSRHYRNRNYGRRHYPRSYYPRSYYRRHHHNHGAAVVAGIIGLAIANSGQRHYNYDDRYYSYQPGSAEWIAACARKYRSFNPRTGLYMTHRGYWRRCRLP